MNTKDNEIFRFLDGNGDSVEAIKRTLEVGDRCVILLPENHKKPNTVLYFTPTGKASILTVQRFDHEHVKFYNHGSWHQDFVYQVLE